MKRTLIALLALATPALAHDEFECACNGAVVAMQPGEVTIRAVGRLRAVDGDTFAVGGIRYRLWGIDAPELGEPCRLAVGGPVDCAGLATEALAELASRPDYCDVVDYDGRWRRPVVACGDGSAADWSFWLVGVGRARSHPGFGTERLRAVETLARERGVGYWACDAPTPPGWEEPKRERCWR